MDERTDLDWTLEVRKKQKNYFLGTPPIPADDLNSHAKLVRTRGLPLQRQQILHRPNRCLSMILENKVPPLQVNFPVLALARKCRLMPARSLQSKVKLEQPDQIAK